MKNKVKRKPTAKEMASAIIEINNKVNECFSVLRQLDEILGLYVKMNGDSDKFNKFIEGEIEKRKKNDKEKNGKSDKKDIPKDSKDEGSGAEGVRKEAG
jgi:hypothetical protein